jgi:hypothetical protein
MVMASLLDPEVTDCPEDSPTDATVPEMGLVSLASANDCWASTREASSLSIWA